MERVNVFIQPLMAHMKVVIEHLKRAGTSASSPLPSYGHS